MLAASFRWSSVMMKRMFGALAGMGRCAKARRSASGAPAAATPIARRASRRDMFKVMTSIAERYVKLVLALGEHDTDYVDAYYGPPEWREAAKGRTLDDIRRDGVVILSGVDGEGPR